MDNKIVDEDKYFEETLNTLCNLINEVKHSNKIISNEYKQKIYTIVSFLEFVRAGAKIDIDIKNENKVVFNINLE